MEIVPASAISSDCVICVHLHVFLFCLASEALDVCWCTTFTLNLSCPAPVPPENSESAGSKQVGDRGRLASIEGCWARWPMAFSYEERDPGSVGHVEDRRSLRLGSLRRQQKKTLYTETQQRASGPDVTRQQTLGKKTHTESFLSRHLHL